MNHPRGIMAPVATPKSGSVMTYTTLPRNLNNAQARSGIKLVPFRPINNGVKAADGPDSFRVSLLNLLGLWSVVVVSLSRGRGFESLQVLWYYLSSPPIFSVVYLIT